MSDPLFPCPLESATLVSIFGPSKVHQPTRPISFIGRERDLEMVAAARASLGINTENTPGKINPRMSAALSEARAAIFNCESVLFIMFDGFITITLPLTAMRPPRPPRKRGAVVFFFTYLPSFFFFFSFLSSTVGSGLPHPPQRGG